MQARQLEQYVDDRPAEQVFRVHRDIYTNPELFDLEMKFIFERTWNFLALESQLAKPHDFITTAIGRTQVLLTRDAGGRLGAFVNTCRHKGAIVCRLESGSSKYHVCPYHGWAYDASGRNVNIKDREAGRYSASFDDENHDLVPLARLQTYKGLVFGSLSEEVPLLEEFLGDMRVFLDLAMDQGPQGMEFVPGRAIYSFRANWKLQMDNGVDPYHLTSTHTSYLDVLARRRAGAGNLAARQFDWKKRASKQVGVFNFSHGHTLVWHDKVDAEKKPIYPVLDEIRSRVGDVRAEWMLKLRNAQIFPNLQIADAIALILRTFHPVAVDRTLMRVHCLAPIGEAPAQRAWRLRQFEDFFNPGGLATPDDAVTYEECQRGYGARPIDFLQGQARGISILRDGPDEFAGELGIRPLASLNATFDSQSEVSFHASYREWKRLMQAGLSGEKAYP